MKKASKLLILAVCLLALVLAMTLVACDGGGQKTTHSDHTASGEWQSDESGHWHVCDEGGEKTDVAAHNLIAQEQDGKHYFKCEVCDYRTEPEAHTPSATYSSDGTNHWQECTVCHLPVNKQAHTPESEVENLGEIGHRFKCEVCQRTIEEAHAFDEENPESDEQNHWLKCLYCDATTQPEAHTLGEYIIDGERHSQQCEECGATVNEAAHKANYALGYFADESGHWYECDCGQKMEFAAHEKNEASYTSNDSEHWYSCKICLYQMEAEAHTLGEYISDGVKHYKQCEVCLRKALMADCVPSEQHISENGEEYHNCETCGKKVEVSTEEFYDMDGENHWLACPVCKKELGAKVAHSGFTKYEYSIEGHWYVCEGCGNRILSEHKYQNDVCTECHYFEGLEFYTFGQQSNSEWYVTSYTGTQTVVKLPTRDADGHTITGFARGTFSDYDESAPHNDYMEEVYIPEGYTELPSNAFKWCAALKKVHFPTTIRYFGSGTFKNSPLEDVYIEDLAAFISAKDGVFYSSLTSYLPFLSHGDESNTFAHPVNLYVKGQLVKDMVVPEGVTQLSVALLADNCFGLESLTLPSTLTSFDICAVTYFSPNYFTGNLTSSDVIRWIPKIIISDADSWFKNVAMNDNGNVQTFAQLNESDIVFMQGGKVVTDIVMPEGVTALGKYQLMTSKNVTTVTLNGELRSIDTYAFRNCENLHAIRNLESTQMYSVESGTFFGLPLDEPLRFPATLGGQITRPTDSDVPLIFAKGSKPNIALMSDWKGTMIVLDQFQLQSTAFSGCNIKEAYFYDVKAYNTFVAEILRDGLSGIYNRPLYDAEAFFYSETSPEDADSQNVKWHWNDKGEIEFWAQTNYADLVTIERNDDFLRDTFYHDITNDGDEYIYRLKAASKSGKEIEWTALTEGATVTQDGDVTATKIGFYKVKAAVKENPSVYSIATVMFYPSAVYYTGTLGGQPALENVNKNAGNLGDREDLKFYDDGTHKSFTLYINAAKNDEFNIGFLGSDVKVNIDSFNKSKSGDYMPYLNNNNTKKTFRLRKDAILTIKLNILEDNSLEVIVLGADSKITYALMVKGRTWPNLSVSATAHLEMKGNYGTTFTTSVVYTATLDNWYNICFATNVSGNTEDQMIIHDEGNSSVYVFGEAYSMEKEPHMWCSSDHNDMHLWYETVQGESNYGSWEFVFTVRADGEILSVEIKYAKEAEE